MAESPSPRPERASIVASTQLTEPVILHVGTPVLLDSTRTKTTRRDRRQLPARVAPAAQRLEWRALPTSFGFHVRLKWRNVLARRGFSRDWNVEKTHDENESPRRRSSFRCDRQPGVRSGRWRIRFGKPQGFGTAAMAALLPRLRSRPRIWATLPGAALRLERRKGPVERGRHRAIAAAFGKLGIFRRNAENENLAPLREGRLPNATRR